MRTLWIRRRADKERREGTRLTCFSKYREFTDLNGIPRRTRIIRLQLERQSGKGKGGGRTLERNNRRDAETWTGEERKRERRGEYFENTKVSSRLGSRESVV